MAAPASVPVTVMVGVARVGAVTVKEVVAVTGVASGRESRPTRETVAVNVPAGSGEKVRFWNMVHVMASIKYGLGKPASERRLDSIFSKPSVPKLKFWMSRLMLSVSKVE